MRSHLVFLQSDPGFDFLHSDSRCRAIVRKAGRNLSDGQWQTSQKLLARNNFRLALDPIGMHPSAAERVDGSVSSRLANFAAGWRKLTLAVAIPAGFLGPGMTGHQLGER